jgi:hypothetical protein
VRACTCDLPARAQMAAAARRRIGCAARSVHALTPRQPIPTKPSSRSMKRRSLLFGTSAAGDLTPFNKMTCRRFSDTATLFCFMSCASARPIEGGRRFGLCCCRRRRATRARRRRLRSAAPPEREATRPSARGTRSRLTFRRAPRRRRRRLRSRRPRAAGPRAEPHRRGRCTRAAPKRSGDRDRATPP